MSDTVQAVEDKGKSDGGFSSNFGSNGSGSNAGYQSSRINSVTECRGSKVCKSTQIESLQPHIRIFICTASMSILTTTDGHASDSVCGRQVPSDLGLVDRQVWGNRANLTLLTQQLGLGGRRLFLNGTRSVEMSVISSCKLLETRLLEVRAKSNLPDTNWCTHSTLEHSSACGWV